MGECVLVHLLIEEVPDDTSSQRAEDVKPLPLAVVEVGYDLLTPWIPSILSALWA